MWILKQKRTAWRNSSFGMLQEVEMKVDWLLSKNRNLELKKIEQVQYFGKNLKIQSNATSTAKHYSFALSPHRNFPDGNVKLHPSSFINFLPPSSISSIRDKWFTNLSSKPIPNNVQFLIQLEIIFLYPPLTKIN